MKICIIITSFDFGGAESLLVNSLNILIENNDISVIYFKGQGKLTVQLNTKIRVYKIPLGILTPFKLRRLIRGIRPEIVHTHVGHADILGLLAITGLRVKKFTTIHNIRYTWNFIDYLYYFLYALTFNLWARDCMVIGASKVVAKHISTRLRVKSGNISILYNAINDCPLYDKIESRKALGQTPDDFIVLFLGRIEKIKSIETLIRAIPFIKDKITNLAIEIVGEGTDREKLEKLAVELGVKKLITFRGPVPEKEPYFAAADVFVLPSLSEAFPTVILESFRAALPVITTRLESIKEIVTENTNGLMFNVEDYQELAVRIIEIATNRSLRARISDNALECFKEKYNQEVYIKNLLQLYTQKVEKD